MSSIMDARKALVNNILEAPGHALISQRRLAFDNANLEKPLSILIDKLANRASEVTDEDVSAPLEAGLSEDQVFELVVCAAVGQATRLHDNALSALRAAMGEE